MMSIKEEPTGAAAVQHAAVTQAAEWFTRNRADDLSAAEKQAFIEWLRASPFNVGEYLATAQLAEDLSKVTARLRAEKPELLERDYTVPIDKVVSFESVRTTEPVESAPRATPRFRRRGIAIAAMIVLAIVLGGVGFWVLRTPGLIGVARVTEVPHGEQRTLQLRDGSVAHLNTDTRIRVRYSRGERLIELERGQALFQVARDPARPFRVNAGATEVVAVGTQFELYRKAQSEVTVTVVEGKVDVLYRNPPNIAADAGVDAAPARPVIRPLRLQAGQQVSLGSADMALQPLAVDLRVATAWVQREVIFSEQPLRDVAAEFSRYSRAPIAIEDPTLRALPVSGIFKAYDVESFVAFLQQFEGVQVDRSNSHVIRVYRRASATSAESVIAGQKAPVSAEPLQR